MQTPLSIDLSKLHGCDEEDVLFCPCDVFGVPHHAQFIKVERNADGILQATKDPHDRLSDLLRLNEGDLLTVKIHGHPGDWLACFYPYAD